MNSFVLPELTSIFDEIIEICKGIETHLETYYESRRGFSDLDPLSNSITDCLQKDAVCDGKFYYHFFRMSIAYLESSCNREDKIIKHIYTLSTVAIPDDNSACVLERMIENQKSLTRNKTEEKFFQVVLEEFDLFSKSIPENLDALSFQKVVYTTLETFLKKTNRWLTSEMYKDSDLETFMDYAKKYFQNHYLSLMRNLVSMYYLIRLVLMGHCG